MTRPSRYTENNSSRDWIDEFIATSSAEEVRGAFRFTIGKYLRRYGKKDDPLQEALKIQDYANRLVAFERELAAPDHVELRRHPMTPNVIEPASEMQDDSERMRPVRIRPPIMVKSGLLGDDQHAEMLEAFNSRRVLHFIVSEISHHPEKFVTLMQVIQLGEDES